MSQTNLNSVIVDLDKEQTEIKPTKDIGLPAKFNLSVLRGQVVFTSAYTIKNDKGTWLFQIDNHYDRLLKSFNVMFESKIFPVSKEKFKTYCQELIDSNKNKLNGNYYQVLILLIAGKSQSLGQEENAYGNGFGGNLAQLLFIANPMVPKPNWAFEKGINVCSLPYQREIADAKPALYLGGIQGQHILSAINTYYIYHCFLENKVSIKNILKNYEQFSDKNKETFRHLMHDTYNNLDNLETINMQNYVGLDETHYQVINRIKTKELSKEKYRYIENNEIAAILHEVIFTTPSKPHFVLEGATFALMGITKQSELCFIPLENPTEEAGQGKVLESTTIKLLKEIIKACNIDFIEKSITLDEAKTFQAFYGFSATRIFSKDAILCPPISSIDGHILSGISNEANQKIKAIEEKMKVFFATYSY